MLGDEGVGEVRQDGEGVGAQVLGEELDVLIDVVVNGNPHVVEEQLVDAQHALVGFFRQDGVYALVQPLCQQNLFCDVGGGVLPQNRLQTQQPVVDVAPLGALRECVQQLVEGLVQVLGGGSKLFRLIHILKVLDYN